MPKFRFLGDQPVTLFQRTGGPDAFDVQPGQTVTVPGDLAADQYAEDAYIVGDDENARAWPKASWELIDDARPGTFSAPPVEPAPET